MQKLKMKQIAVGQFTSGAQRLLSFVVVGLSEDGDVYQHRFGKGWVPIGDETPATRKSQSQQTADKDETPW